LLAQAVLGGVPSPVAMKSLQEILLFPLMLIVSLIISLIPLWTSATFTGFTITTFATLHCK
jgi:hypothetical protein